MSDVGKSILQTILDISRFLVDVRLLPTKRETRGDTFGIFPGMIQIWVAMLMNSKTKLEEIGLQH
jgi:hypothetical protein